MIRKDKDYRHTKKRLSEELNRDRLFQRSEDGSVLSLGHPRYISLGVRMAFVVSSIYATDI